MQPDQAMFMISRIISQANAALSLSLSKRILEDDMNESLVEKLENE